MCGLCACYSISVFAQKPNFVVLIADDLGRDDLSIYGNGTVKTPNIERFAQEGMRCDNVFLTASSSSPSRCSILTSLYPHNTGAAGLMQSLPNDREMVSVPLRQAGYYTVSVGKWHQGPYVENQFDKIVLPIRNAPQKFGEQVVDFLKNRPTDKPFFLWAAALDPHRPYTKDTPRINNSKDVYVPPYYPDNDMTRTDLSDYYNEITRFDEHLGMILDELERQGIMGNTFIVVMSDNGRPFPQAKTRCNLQGMATPFIIRYAPLVKRGSVSKAIISSIDLMPTVLDLVGISYSNKVDGQSFKAILDKPAASFREYAYAEHNFHDFMAYERAIYTSDYILIHNFLPELPGTPPADAIKGKTYQGMLKMYQAGKLPMSQSDIFTVPRSEYELYDYRNDHHCMDNLHGKKEYKKIFFKLSRKLEYWRKEVNDFFPGKDKLIEDRFDRTTGTKVREYDIFL